VSRTAVDTKPKDPAEGRVQGPGPRSYLRVYGYAPGVLGQMNVLQFAKNVRELSPMISVAE
jgi:hypothetical protein